MKYPNLSVLNDNIHYFLRNNYYLFYGFPGQIFFGFTSTSPIAYTLRTSRNSTNAMDRVLSLTQAAARFSRRATIHEPSRPRQRINRTNRRAQRSCFSKGRASQRTRPLPLHAPSPPHASWHGPCARSCKRRGPHGAGLSLCVLPRLAFPGQAPRACAIRFPRCTCQSDSSRSGCCRT